MMRLAVKVRSLRPAGMPSFTLPYRAVNGYRGFGDVLMPEPAQDAQVIAIWSNYGAPGSEPSPRVRSTDDGPRTCEYGATRGPVERRTASAGGGSRCLAERDLWPRLHTPVRSTRPGSGSSVAGPVVEGARRSAVLFGGETAGRVGLAVIDLAVLGGEGRRTGGSTRGRAPGRPGGSLP